MFRGAASIIGKETDGAFLLITGICLVLLAVITFFMVYFLLRYRKNANPEDIEGNPPLELSFLASSVALVIFMFYLGWGGYKTIKEETPADAFPVRAHAQQWHWGFEYPNGVESDVLNLPEGRPVRIDLDSKDVIHGFYIPAFRIKQDAVPGAKKTVWFTPDEAGSFDLFCTQYCGVGHSTMITSAVVMKGADFDGWYTKASAEKKAVALAAPTSKLAARGKELYSSKGCSGCHSLDGSKLVGPTWKNLYGSRARVTTGGKEREVAVDDEYIHRSEMDPNADIVVGYPAVMPPQKGLLSDDDIKAIIEFMKTLK